MPDSDLKNKQKILKIFLKNTTLSGWNDQALKEAFAEADLGWETREYFADIFAMLDFYVAENNREFEIQSRAIDFTKLRVRDKIKELVKLRLLIEGKNKNSLKSLINFKQKKLFPRLLRNSYQIADVMWEIAGDNSEDFSFYSKRIILAKVFSRSLVFFLNDESENHQKSWRFLDDQIESVMKIARIKSGLKKYTANLQNCSEVLKEKLHKLPFFRLINPKRK